VSAPVRATSRRLDYDDAYTTRFDARVAAVSEHAGRPAVELESTYFYPEGGGQEADRGTLGGVPVTDVQSDDDGRIWHVVANAASLPSGSPAEIDWARRFDHMQQHTGQHILSAAFERVLGAATLSSHLGEERSSIEVGLADTDWRALETLERETNRIVWEDRPVERHWVDAEGVKRFALRKPPVVTDSIRIVEIPDWDVSACGGTHTRRTGEVGIIKVVRWERVRGNLRFEFLCGGRALSDHAWRLEALLEAAKRRTLKDRELIAHLERAAEERDALAKRVREMSAQLVAAEAVERVGDPPRPVAERFPARARDEVRQLALTCLARGAPWIALAAAGPEPVVIAGRAKGPGRDLRELLPELLARARGKGGGSPELVQVAAADGAAAEAAWAWVRTALSGVEGGDG
jgi:alanyl-tRNA synthetase